METESRMPSCMMSMSTVDGQGIFQSMPIDRPSCMFTISPQSSPDTIDTKYYKVMKENVRDMVCKRRLDFTEHSDYLGLTKAPSVAVARRNERERNRVKLINMTFATLREHIPSGNKSGKSKKMSKVDTLKAAIDYIRYMQQLVDEHDAVNAVLDGNCNPKPKGIPASPSIHSPSPSTCSENSGEGLSVEDEDLMDFTNWF